MKVERKDLLMPLREFEAKQRQSLGDKCSFKDVVNFFLEDGSNVATLVENNQLLGVISKNDLLIKYCSDLKEGKEVTTPKKYMIDKPFSLNADQTLLDAMLLMLRKEVTSVPVLEQDQSYLKTLDYEDILFWLLEHFREYFDQVPALESWSYLDSNILENDFFENGKGTLDTTFFSNTLQKVLIRNAFNIDENMSLGEFIATSKVNKGGIASVTRYESTMLGLITPNEVFRCLEVCDHKPDFTLPVKSIMNVQYRTLMKKHSIALAVATILHKNLEFLIIMDEDHYPLGVARAFDILKYITDALFYEAEPVLVEDEAA
jgi:predicted transcriptional regulator